MPDNQNRIPGGRPAAPERQLYTYEVRLRKTAPDGTAEDIVFHDVQAPSMLNAYERTLDDAVARSGHPDDPLHGSRFEYPRSIARRMGIAGAPPGAAPARTADRPAPPQARRPLGSGAAGARPPADASARTLAETLAARSEDAGERPAEEERAHAYTIRLNGTDPEGRRHTLLWRGWRGRSLLGSYRTVLDSLAADPGWAGWRFEAQPFTIRERIRQQGPTRGARPVRIPDPDLVAERLGAEPPSDALSDEELHSLDGTWR